MIKGCQKRMIFVKNTGSDIFDEAYFVLKKDVPYEEGFEEDIVRTATAIINQNPFRKRLEKPKKNLSSFFCFLIGLAVGIAGMLIFSFIF